MELVSSSVCHGGKVQKYKHFSEQCKTEMKFSIFVPKKPEGDKLPGLLFLSGLTCTEDNFIQKSCAIKRASQLGIYLVCPDTSPRGAGVDGEDDSYDIGTGAGFYLDATESKWSQNYKMYSYVSKELPQLLFEKFSIDPSRLSIFGHSMGGHGALTIALKNPKQFKSCSALSPICNPIEGAWGKKALSTYLGADSSSWSDYDATELLKKLNGILPIPVLITQGKDDEFYSKGQLLPENFMAQVKQGNEGQPITYNLVENYDHSYWFIQSFIDEHIDFHAAYLGVAL